jgi:hypothetical protein
MPKAKASKSKAKKPVKAAKAKPAKKTAKAKPAKAAKAKPAKAAKAAKASKPAKAPPAPVLAPSGVHATSWSGALPTFAEATRESNARDAAQKPFIKQYEAVKTLDQLASLLKKNASTYDFVPWLSWICAGAGKYGDSEKWTEKRDKTDPKKQKQLVSIIEALIEGGAELALPDERGRNEEDSLAKLVRFDELTVEQRVKLVGLAIANGADPSERLVYPLFAAEDGPCIGLYTTKSALDTAIASEENREAFLKVMADAAGKAAVEDSFLRVAIDDLRSASRKPEYLDDWMNQLVDRAGANLNRVVTKLDSTDRAALVHFLCGADANAAALERLIDRVDVDLPLPDAMTTGVSIRWGVVPTVRIPTGGTPLDIVDAILGFVTRGEAANEKKPDDQFRPAEAKTYREEAEKKRALLAGKGARHGETKVELPPVLAQTGEQILRLAKLLGSDEQPIRAAMAAIDTDGMGPWGFLRALVPPFESELVSEKLNEPLAQLLSAFTCDRWSNEFRKSGLPASRRASAELAIEFHSDDDARLLAVKADGGTQIWKLVDDEVTVVAPSVPEYLKAEIDRWQA